VPSPKRTSLRDAFKPFKTSKNLKTSMKTSSVSPPLPFMRYIVTCKEYEVELENENEHNSRRLIELEHENESISKELERLKEKYSREVKEVGKENEQVKASLQEYVDQSKASQKRVVTLELDNEDYERQLRISESIITDLEQKLDTSLEEIALLQSELEELKNHS